MAYERYGGSDGYLPLTLGISALGLLIWIATIANLKKIEDPETYRRQLQRTCPEALQNTAITDFPGALQISEDSRGALKIGVRIPHSVAKINAALVVLEHTSVPDEMKEIHVERLQDLRAAGLSACKREHEEYAELRYEELLSKGISDSE